MMVNLVGFSNLVFFFFLELHRITEWSGLEGTSVGHPVQLPVEAGSPRAGGTGPHPGGSWVSPEKETPQPPWAACSSGNNLIVEILAR